MLTSAVVSICMVPHTSEWSDLSLALDFWGKNFWKLPLVCLLCMHSLHTVSGMLIWGSPLTIEPLLRKEKYLKFKWSKRMCHNHSALSGEREKHWWLATFITTQNVLFLESLALMVNFLFLSNTPRQLSSICITNPFCNNYLRFIKLVFNPRSFNTSSIITSLPFSSRNTTLPKPSTYRVLSSADFIFPCATSIFMNQSLLPVIWMEQPESKYHEVPFASSSPNLSINITGSESDVSS